MGASQMGEFVTRRTLSACAALAASLIFGLTPASATQKDPDLAGDPGAAIAIVTQLLAPDPTLGSSDATATGVGVDSVGIGNALTNPPAETDPSPGNTLYVDQESDADGDCPATAFTSIQAAVDASGPNDTIKVCPDTYAEQVQITGHNHDGLKLVSVQPLGAVIQWPAVDTPLTDHQLVDVKNADRVSIRGFTITGPFNSLGCSTDRHEGVLFENAFDGRLAYNHVTLIWDSNPALFGCQQGDAVAVGRRLSNAPPFGVSASARVENNWIDQYQKNGVQVWSPGTFASVENNTITGSTDATLRASIISNGVVVFGQAAAVVDHNEISRNHWTPAPESLGIILDLAPPGSSRADHNRIFDNDLGIETDSVNNIEISHNDILNNLSDAIWLCGLCGPTTGIVVRANEVHGNGGSGVLLEGAKANLVKSNEIESNGPAPPGIDTTDGIRVDSTSTGNQIRSNQLRGNVTHDCHDDSTGTASAGTANTWNENQGQTENRPGLCEPPPCQEADGAGHFQGQQQADFSADNDGCKDGDADSVQSGNRGDGKSFQSTRIDSVKYDAVANTFTVSGAGLVSGVPMTFVFVELESGPTTPGWVSFTFSDGYSNAGNLLDGSISLH